jgi:hypothetical protein
MGYAATSTSTKLQVIQNKILWTACYRDGYTRRSDTSIHTELKVRRLKERNKIASASYTNASDNMTSLS